MSYADYVENDMASPTRRPIGELHDRVVRAEHAGPRPSAGSAAIKLQQLGPIHLNDLYRDLQHKQVTPTTRRTVDTTQRSTHASPTFVRKALDTARSPRHSPKSSPTRNRCPKTPSPRSSGVPRNRPRSEAPSPYGPSGTSTRSSAAHSRTQSSSASSTTTSPATPLPRECPRPRPHASMWTAEQTRTFLDWARHRAAPALGRMGVHRNLR